MRTPRRGRHGQRTSSRPGTERKRPPGHRDARKEDLRGVRSRELGPHLVLLAEDEAGYRSLCRLASAAHLGGTKGVPRFTHELLTRNTEGLVALTGCRHGEISRRLLAGDRREARTRGGCRSLPAIGSAADSIVELQHHLLPDDDWLVAELARLAYELGLPTLVTNDAHYARPEGRELQDVLVGIRHGLSLDACHHLRRPNGEYFIKGGAGAACPSAGTARRRCARERGVGRGNRQCRRRSRRACSVELEFERYRFPGFDVPNGETPYSELVRLCHDGMRASVPPTHVRVVKQMAHELDVIERTGLAEFFLICWDLMKFCTRPRHPRAGEGQRRRFDRGLRAGHHARGPHPPQPAVRALHQRGPDGYPDVDIDFASSRREEVIQYVYEKYGTEHTGMVCNVVTYRARSAVREVGYALGFPRPLVDRVAKALETYDSVMVRRDLEAEGGFAEFFQVPRERKRAIRVRRRPREAACRRQSPRPWRRGRRSRRRAGLGARLRRTDGRAQPSARQPPDHSDRGGAWRRTAGATRGPAHQGGRTADAPRAAVRRSTPRHAIVELLPRLKERAAEPSRSPSAWLPGPRSDKRPSG